MNIYRYLLSILLLLALPVGMAHAVTPQEQRANSDLELMAQDIAKLVAQPGFRGFLRSEMAKSKNREGIIELDKFLERASKQKKMPPGLGKVTGKVKATKKQHKDMELTGLEGFDLYIPVKAHKTKWKGGKDFIIAASPYGQESDIKQIVGFSVWDGKKVTLNPDEAPDTVVMVVAPEEHLNHDMPEPEPKDKVKNAPHDEKPDPEAGKGEEHQSYFSMSYLKIHRDQEPWTRGDPEVYLLVGQICDGKGKGYYYDMAKVNKTNSWYYTYYLNQTYFNSNCSYETIYSVWERDGSGGGIYGYSSNGVKLNVRLSCYPNSSCSTQYVHTLWRGKGDDPIYQHIPNTITHKMLGNWYYHNYDSRYSDSRYASAKFYKRH